MLAGVFECFFSPSNDLEYHYGNAFNEVYDAWRSNKRTLLCGLFDTAIVTTAHHRRRLQRDFRRFSDPM